MPCHTGRGLKPSLFASNPLFVWSVWKASLRKGTKDASPPFCILAGTCVIHSHTLTHTITPTQTHPHAHTHKCVCVCVCVCLRVCVYIQCVCIHTSSPYPQATARTWDPPNALASTRGITHRHRHRHRHRDRHRHRQRHRHRHTQTHTHTHVGPGTPQTPSPAGVRFESFARPSLARVSLA